VSEWWTYTLGDFLMFSPVTYWRLVENDNKEVWPVQIAGLIAGIIASGLTYRTDPARPGCRH
jgi:hypothetical protein